jgi:hypothetical protein
VQVNERPGALASEGNGRAENISGVVNHDTQSWGGAGGADQVISLAAGRIDVDALPRPRTAVGLVEARMFPLSSVTTQSEADAHAICWGFPGMDTPARVQVLAPPVGRVEVSSPLGKPIATHNLTVGHAS